MRRSNVFVCLLSVCLFPATALALKPFALVEDGYSERVGQFELENTFTLSYHTHDEHNFQNYSMEHELEYGMAENFTLRVKGSYFYEKSEDTDGLHFDAGGVEGQLYFTNSNIDPVGISVIAAFEFGENSLINEDFVVVQKDFQNWIVAYNFGLTTEVDGVFHSHDQGTQTTGSIINAGGIDYVFSNSIRAGAEISAESSYDNWSDYTGTVIYAGPAINWTPVDQLWITVGFDWQLSNHHDEPDYLLTIIVGYYF